MSPIALVTQGLIAVTVLILVAAALVVVVRISRGPTALDRVVAADVLVAIVLAALATEQIATRDSTGLPVLLVVSLVGFTGAVAMARLIVRQQGQREKYRRALAHQQPGDGALPDEQAEAAP